MTTLSAASLRELVGLANDAEPRYVWRRGLPVVRPTLPYACHYEEGVR